MIQLNSGDCNLSKIRAKAIAKARLCALTTAFLFIGVIAAFDNFSAISAQTTVKILPPPIAAPIIAAPPTPFPVGEKLTYNISFEKFDNAAYAEIAVVSRGKLGSRDAVELQTKFKTTELVSAFYLVDETRTTFAAGDSGLPLYTRVTSRIGVTPKENISNNVVNPTAYNDLLTMIYQARTAGGSGNFTFQDDDKIYSALFTNTGKIESLNAAAGIFETSVSNVESGFLTDRGIKNLTVNFSTDDARIPVVFHFRTAKGLFRAEIASIQTPVRETIAAAPPPVIVVPPVVVVPKPIATPLPYVDNQPLSKDLPFALGETLDYQISNSGQLLGLISLQARERKQSAGRDSLLLTATVTGAQPNQQVFKLSDAVRATVNPESLAPQQIEFKLSGALGAYNQQVSFDQQSGSAISSKGSKIDVPVGTHSLLSLAYAVRSFNLKPSKDLTNPVNDTRVAVFLDTQSYVFTLRPATASIINLRGETVSAQLISISTGNPAIDRYNIRLWLSNDDKRLPLRLAFGTYQADLVTEKEIPFGLTP